MCLMWAYPHQGLRSENVSYSTCSPQKRNTKNVGNTMKDHKHIYTINNIIINNNIIYIYIHTHGHTWRRVQVLPLDPLQRGVTCLAVAATRSETWDLRRLGAAQWHLDLGCHRLLLGLWPASLQLTRSAGIWVWCQKWGWFRIGVGLTKWCFDHFIRKDMETVGYTTNDGGPIGL